MLEGLDMSGASAGSTGRIAASEWPAWNGRVNPAPGETFVFRLDLSAADDETVLAAERLILSPDEAARASRFRFPRDQRQFTLTRATLRRVLAAITGDDAAHLTFRYGEAGKPELAHHEEIAFSVSHSGDLALIAVAIRDSEPVELGIDLEAHRAIPDLLGIATRFFAPEEARGLAGLGHGVREAAFMRLWVTKEACVKACGRGLAALEEVNELVSSGRPLPWAVSALDVGQRFSAAIAHAPRPNDIRLWTVTQSSTPRP